MRKWTTQQMEKAIREHISYSGVLKQLGMRAAGGNFQTIRNFAKKHAISLDHFKGKGWAKGETAKNAIPLKDLLVKDCYYSTSKFKKRIFKAELLDNKCSECGLESEWNEKPIVLEIDHKNGDRYDNRISNLRVLCPNCHSQTPNFRGRKLRQNNLDNICHCGQKIDKRSKRCSKCWGKEQTKAG